MANGLLVVNADGPETRVALVEGGLLAELYIERKRERGIAGNIYKGRVERVLPGMQAAFLNIGLEKSAYIHVSDVRGTPDDLKRLVSAGDSSRGEPDNDEDSSSSSNGARIEDLLKEGQEIVVQVTKEPISTKGARTTRYISLPGRHLVFMPTVDHIGISRRIASDKERRRLRDIVEQMRPPGSGFIVRTVAEGVPEKDLRADMGFLIKMWNEVVAKIGNARCPSLIYNDLDLLLRTVRDLFTPEVEKLIIDTRPEYDRIKKFISTFMPDFIGQIELYDGVEPIFDGYGIEIEIDRALERKVWLKSGGYLIVDEMEALTAVDVNTGRFVGKKSLEDTITQTNLEAAREVAEQLRIRSIGGMIVVDFIDMDRASNRDKVMRAFNDFLKRDRNKATVTRISELGLVEMTRKRTRESLLHNLTEPCAHCEGKGYTKSRRTIAYELMRELRRLGGLIEGDTVIVEVHPDVAQSLATTDRAFLDDMEKRLQKRIIVKGRGSFHLEDFEIRSPGEKPLEKTDLHAGRDDKFESRRRRRKQVLASPEEVEAMLEEEERQSVNAEALAEMFTEVREQHVVDQAAALEARSPPGATPQEPLVTGPGPLATAGPPGGETEPILINGDFDDQGPAPEGPQDASAPRAAEEHRDGDKPGDPGEQQGDQDGEKDGEKDDREGIDAPGQSFKPPG
jgi:ribonuclease G